MALAAPTLAATVRPDTGGVDLVVSAIPAGATSVTITRTHPSGRVWIVRQWNGAPTGGAPSMAGTDYEAPIGVAVTYAVTAKSATETSPSSNTVTVTLEASTSDTVWLKDPRVPALNRRVLVEKFDTQQFDGRVGVMPVIGRPTPVTIGDVREAATGTIVLTVLTADDVVGIHYLTASGNPLLFQTSSRYGVGNLYMAVTKVTEGRLSRLGMYAERRMSLDFVEVDPPVGLPSGGQNTYQTVKDGYATYSAVVAGERDYLDLVQHTNTGGAQRSLADLVPWRGG